MKYLLLILALVSIGTMRSNAQSTRQVGGTIIDSTKLTLPGSNIRLSSDKGDSTVTIADANGKFTFPAVKGTKINLAITSIGYQAVIKHYTLDAGTGPVILDPIILRSDTRQLAQVTIVGVNPVVFKEDTVEYKVSAYKVRENAPVEDVLKKIPGLDVARDGTVTAQGKQVTKVRVNGKDYFTGDVASATKNLPADLIESVQVVDDYGDQANLTGIKTGEPEKILNFTIRKDKNHGYYGQATVGDGQDAIPETPTVKNENRYLGLLNLYQFNNDEQLAVLGSINNTNVNTFSFGSPTGGAQGGGGFSGGRGGGGGGRGNAARGASGSTTNANGITNARSFGLNYRDEWGKKLSVYGNYSFNNNSTYTNSTIQQTNYVQTPSISNQSSQETDHPNNHRFNFNAEWRPDTVNYLKLTPTFNYSGNDVTSYDAVNSQRAGVTNLAYTSNSISNSSSPNFGLNGLYNHRFSKKGRNFSLSFNGNTSKNSSFDNPIYTYITRLPDERYAPANQINNTDSRNNSWGFTASYLEPIGKVSYLELNYGHNHSNTTSDKLTDTLNASNDYVRDPLLSNSYTYTFTTDRFGLNYRVIQPKYNLTFGIGGQPTTLDGRNLQTNVATHVTNFNIVPAASFNYNFSRSKALRLNYSGTSNQPSFNQLQPVIDYSNALYPVQGNPNLEPEFANNIQLRYNNFSFQTGDMFFSTLSYTATNNKIVSNIISYPTYLLTQYLNTNGYYQLNGNFVYAKPWKERRYTLMFGGNIAYTNNIGYSQDVNRDLTLTAMEKNIAKTVSIIPNIRFRTNITDVIDAELSSRYTINRTSNSQKSGVYADNNNTSTLELSANGKNYFKDWTVSYDYTKQVNYGYAAALNVKNPNLFNASVERRFLKDHRGTLRLAAYDIFNENTGFSTVTNGSVVTQTNVNRLGRYFLLSFTLRLQKFAGKAPANTGGGFRNGGGDRGPGAGASPAGGPPAGGTPPGGGISN